MRTLAAAAFAAALAAAACGGQDRSDMTRDRSDARAVYRVASSFRVEIADRAGVARVRARDGMNRERRSCPGLIRSEPVEAGRIGDEGYIQLRAVQLLAPDYADFARRMAELPVHHRALRLIVRAVDRNREVVQRLADTSLSYCDFLARWKRSHWTSVELDRLTDPVVAAGFRRAEHNRAQKAAIGSLEQLVGLGLTLVEAVDVSSPLVLGN